MPSRAIYGKPGGGKSYFTTWKVILNELVNGNRYIVTNVVLRVENWVPYLVSIGRPDIVLSDRVLLIGSDNMKINGALYGDEDVKDFWRFRSPSQVLPALSAEDIKAGRIPEIPDGTACHYVLDELHEHLNSRQWMKTGPLMLWYIAKHRHFGDDVTWITQSVPNVDKQFRSVTQDYTEVRNYGKEKFRGFVKGEKFEAVTYLEYDPAGKLTPQETIGFKLDKTVANLYYTSTKGGEADKGVKLKGINVKWIFVAVAALCILLSLAFIYVPGWVGKKMGQNVDKPKPVPPARGAAVGKAESDKDNVLGVNLDTPDLAPGPSASPEPILHVVGIPFTNVPADRALNALLPEKKEGFTAVPNGSNDALIVSGTNLQSVIGFGEIARQYDRTCALVTVEAVVGRLVKGRGVKYGLYDFLRTSASNGNGGLGSLLESVSWDAATGLVTFGTSGLARYALQAVTDFEAKGYRFEVVSRPTLSVLSGQSAEFASGREIPIPVTVSDQAGTQTSVQYRDAEFKFEVNPTVLPSGVIRLYITQSNSEVLSNAELGGNVVPTLSTQKVRTIVDIKPGQVGYLGGLTYRTKRRERQGVPILGDIPGLSLIFASKDNGEESGELVIFLTVSKATDAVVGPSIRKATPARGDSFVADTESIPRSQKKAKKEP